MGLVANKKQFIKFIEHLLDDDAVVVVTNDKMPTVKYSKKTKTKDVGFRFPDIAFSRQQDIGGYAFGDFIALGITICKESDLSQQAKEVIRQNEVQNPKSSEI